MKTTKTLLFSCLLFLGLVLSKTSMAQKGPSCDSAKVLSYPINNSVTSFTANTYWFKVTLGVGQYALKVKSTGGNKITNATTYTGSCSSLSFFQKDSISIGTDTSLIIFIKNTTTTTFYVKLNKTVGSGNFVVTTTPNLLIGGDLGYCPGQSVNLLPIPVNPNGTPTYTWLPSGSNASSITVSPSGTVNYTLTYSDANGIITKQ